MYGYNLGYNIARQGSKLNRFYAWMGKPNFALPNSGVALLIGQEVTIYGDALINVPIENDLNVTYTCDIGTQSGNNYTINPTDAGEHNLTITFRNGNRLIVEETITLTVYAEVSTLSKEILMVGDSIMAQGITYYATQINTILDGVTFTFVGTQGDTVKHEGYGGYSWATFVSSSSPFVKNGEIDIAAYFTDNVIGTPDIVKFDLGVNDVFGSSDVNGDGLTDAEIAAIITDAKSLIDAFLTYDANVKIVLGLPTICENTGDGWNANYDESVYNQDLYIQNIHKYSVAFANEFANGNYNSRVDCSYEAIVLDRDLGYPKKGDPLLHYNGVHPSTSGYNQLGVGKSIYLNKSMQGNNLILNTWPNNAYWNIVDAAWSGDGVKMSCSGGNGWLRKYNFWENGKKYIIVVKATVVSGTLFPPYAGSTFSGSITTSGTHAFIYDPAVDYFTMLIYSSSFVGSIDYFEIREIK